MVLHLGFSFPFGPADSKGVHFQKPLASQNLELESWNVKTVCVEGIEHTLPLLGGLTFRWPVVCGLTGGLPDTGHPLPPREPSVLSALPVSAQLLSAAKEAGLSIRKGQLSPRPGGGGSMKADCCCSNRGLCGNFGERSPGDAADGGRIGSVISCLASICEVWHLSAWMVRGTSLRCPLAQC